MSITTSAGKIRSVTFWYSAEVFHFGDLSAVFVDGIHPQRRLLAAEVRSDRHRDQLAAPTGGAPVRCAGGQLSCLDLDAARGEATEQAKRRYDEWAQTGRVRGRRPGGVEGALLQRGECAYVTYHRLRRIVGDALVIRADDTQLHPAGCAPDQLVDYVRLATALLADAAPNDVLVALAV